jgi:hypothetical protein
MENYVKKLVQDISQLLETKLTDFENVLAQKKILIQTLHDYFWKNKARIPQDCGILTAANKENFTQFQLLFFSAAIAHSVHFGVIDEGMSSEQQDWCRDQENITLIARSNIYKNEWNRPHDLLSTPFQTTLWLEPNCVVINNLDEIFKIICQKPLLIEDPEKTNAADLHIAMKTNLVPHHSGPPHLKSGLFGYQLKRDKELIQKWAESIEKTENIARNVWRVLQWIVESNNQLHLILNGPEWTDHTPLPPTTNVFDFLRTLPNNINILTTPYDTKDWEFLPLTIKDFPVITAIKFHELCHIFVMGETALEQQYLEAIPSIDVYQNPRLQLVDTTYIGILSANDPKTQCCLKNVEELATQLMPDKILSPTITSEQWASVSKRRDPEIGNILDDVCQQFELTLDNSTIVGNNFICHRDVFLKLLAFWNEVYSYLLDQHNNVTKPDFVHMHIPMLFFANCGLQLAPIMDRQIRVSATSPLPYEVCRFNGIIDAAFRNLTHAENYCEQNGYRYCHS